MYQIFSDYCRSVKRCVYVYHVKLMLLWKSINYGQSIINLSNTSKMFIIFYICKNVFVEFDFLYISLLLLPFMTMNDNRNKIYGTSTLMSLYGSSLFIEKSRQNLGVAKFLAPNACRWCVRARCFRWERAKTEMRNTRAFSFLVYNKR